MHWQFDAVLNDTLRDGHVVGLCSEAIQKKLVTEDTYLYQNFFYGKGYGRNSY